MSGTNQYGARDASVRLDRIRGAVRALSKQAGIQTTRSGPSGSFSNPASNLIDTELIASLGVVSLPPLDPPSPPPPPTNVVGQSEDSQILLSWDFVSGLTYRVVAPAISLDINGISTGTYTITSVSNGITYSCSVYAVNTAGQSAPVSVQITPLPAGDRAVMFLDAANYIDGTLWPDTCGADNSATLYNSPVWDASFNGEFIFDGSGQYGRAPAGFANFTGGMTILAFVNFGSANGTIGWERIIDFGNAASSNNFVLARNGLTNTLQFEVFNGSTATLSAGLPNGVINSAVGFYAARIDGSRYLLKNQLIDISGASTAQLNNIQRNNNYIGRSNWSPDAYFEHSMNIVAIYNTALTNAQIDEFYELFRTRFTPGAPTGVSATAGALQATVSFTAPTNVGGSPITLYTVTSSPGSITATGSSSPIIVPGLTAGTPYTFTVVATNTFGLGDTSFSSDPVTPTAGGPAAPTGLSSVGGDGVAYILFTAGANNGSAITNYEYSTDGGATFTAFSPAQTISPVQISGLTNSTTYTVQLKAVNANGVSPASTSVSVTPTVNTLNATNRLINLDASNASSYSGSGTTWTNLDSGGAYSATLLGTSTPTYTSSGPKYLTFDGTDQIADISQTAAINPSIGTNFTVQIWARVDTASPNFNFGDGLISKQFGFPSYDGYSLSLRTDNSLYLKMNGSSVDGTYSSTTGAYSNGWALYTIVVDFGGGAGSPSKVYVSTVQVVSGNNNETGIPSATAPLQFPRGIQEGQTYCPADVGAFYLYNTILSQADIIRNFDATRARFGV